MNTVRKFITLTVAVLAAMIFGMPAQAQGGREVSASLQDSGNGDPISFATVSLTRKGEKEASKYALTDDSGKVTISKVAPGIYVFKAEMLGYKPFEKEISIAKDNLALGVLKMDPDAQALDAASVSATGNPIVMKKDTIEYNASSFKTTDNDMLEDLLKKLPGVEVNEDGSVTANGKTISKITIAGKTFFLDDPQLASKNIPAKIIDKVKVVDKKSEQAEFTGIDDGNEETIIDLSIQKGMMNGLFGNAMLGGGHDVPDKGAGAGDWRYQGAAFVGRFSEKNQISIILNGNNTNHRGFNDMSGSMMQGMRGGGGGMGRGQGGWGNGNGITTSWMAGLNGNATLFHDKMEAGGNYLYNATRKSVEEEQEQITYLNDYNLHYSTKGYNNTNSDGHRFGLRIEHKFSENTSILFQPQVNFGYGSFREWSEFDTRRGAGELGSDDYLLNSTNKGFNSNMGDNKNWQTNGFFLFRQRLGMPGRTLTVNVRYNFSGNNLNGFNQSLTTTWENPDCPKDSIINQRFASNQKGSSLTGRVTYTEPLGKGFYVEANYEFGWNKNTSTKNTYDSGLLSGTFGMDNLLYNPEGEVLNSTYSNNIINRYINQRAGANFMYQKDKLHAQLGAAVIPTNTHNETNGKVYDNKVINWSPSAMLWYEINDNTNVRAFYFGRSAQPSTSQLMAVPDNTDPLRVSYGNPYLKPYFNHSLRSEFRMSQKRKFLSVNAGIEGSLVQNPIVNATWYNATGAQYSMPVNGHNSGNASFRLSVNGPIAKSNFSIFSMTRASWSTASSYISTNFDSSRFEGENGDFNYEAFNSEYANLDDHAEEFTRNDIHTVSAVERLRLTYRNDLVEVTVGGRTRLNKSWYTMASSNTNLTWNNQVNASMNWTIPGGVGLVADVNYNWYNGYTTPQKDEVILNATVTKLLFKDKVTLSLKAYDILNQAKNLSVTDSANFHRETRNNTLGRYIILSVAYRFGNFGGKGGRGYGRGPGGFGGRGPMGPPPMR